MVGWASPHVQYGPNLSFKLLVSLETLGLVSTSWGSSSIVGGVIYPGWFPTSCVVAGPSFLVVLLGRVGPLSFC